MDSGNIWADEPQQRGQYTGYVRETPATAPIHIADVQRIYVPFDDVLRLAFQFFMAQVFIGLIIGLIIGVGWLLFT